MKISPKVIDIQEGYNKNFHEDHWTKETWDYYLFITMKNLKDAKTKIFSSKTRGGKELSSSSALDSLLF